MPRLFIQEYFDLKPQWYFSNIKILRDIDFSTNNCFSITSRHLLKVFPPRKRVCSQLQHSPTGSTFARHLSGLSQTRGRPDMLVGLTLCVACCDARESSSCQLSGVRRDRTIRRLLWNGSTGPMRLLIVWTFKLWYERGVGAMIPTLIKKSWMYEDLKFWWVKKYLHVYF